AIKIPFYKLNKSVLVLLIQQSWVARSGVGIKSRTGNQFLKGEWLIVVFITDHSSLLGILNCMVPNVICSGARNTSNFMDLLEQHRRVLGSEYGYYCSAA